MFYFIPATASIDMDLSGILRSQILNLNSNVQKSEFYKFIKSSKK